MCKETSSVEALKNRVQMLEVKFALQVLEERLDLLEELLVSLNTQDYDDDEDEDEDNEQFEDDDEDLEESECTDCGCSPE